MSYSFHDYISHYPYLFSQFIWLMFYIAGFIIFRKYYREILFAGLFALPQALLAIPLFSKTWLPERVMGGIIGPEDFIFVFLAGGMSLMTVLWRPEIRVRIDPNVAGVIRRTALTATFALIAVAALYFIGIRGYNNPFIVMLCWSIMVIVQSKAGYKMFFTGAIIFALVYFIGVVIILCIWPDLPSVFQMDQLWGITILKVPAEEFVWAFLYGGTWCLTVDYLLNGRRLG